MWSLSRAFIASMTRIFGSEPEEDVLPVYNISDEKKETSTSLLLLSEKSDLELSEIEIQPARSYLVSKTFREKSAWLLLYFTFNLVLTIQNKWVMSRFAFPYTLTGIHALCNCIGIGGLMAFGTFKPTGLTKQQCCNLFYFSILYAINIAISNVSLNLVTVPVHQVVRSLTPIIIVVLSIIFLHKHFSLKTYLALGTITFGVTVATYGTYGVTLYGLAMTFLGAVLAAVKTLTATGMLKAPNGNKLSPVDILFYMSPLAVVYMIGFAYCSGEASRLYEIAIRGVVNENINEFTTIPYQQILYNGAIAFGLNFVSFTANKKTGAVAISVAANVKQVLSIILAVFIFDLQIVTINAVGIVITLAAGAWYAQIEFSAKKNNQQSNNVSTSVASPMLEQTKTFTC